MNKAMTVHDSNNITSKQSGISCKVKYIFYHISHYHNYHHFIQGNQSNDSIILIYVLMNEHVNERRPTHHVSHAAPAIKLNLSFKTILGVFRMG